MVRSGNKNRKLIVVSNRLPFSRFSKNGKSVWIKSTGGLITALDPILRKYKGIWLGWDGNEADDARGAGFRLIDIADIESREEKGSKKGSYKIGCVPITKSEYEGYYNSFSNSTLWALFHYFFEKSSIEYPAWRTYCEVNKRFAEYITRVASKDDIVWIQDFHLFMTPYYLRKIRPEQEIHFFLHTPFPNIDIFSILPWQSQIMKSLLCCNTVGFHHRQYLRNFMQAVKIHRKMLRRHGRKEDVEDVNGHFYVNPISIDYDIINRTSRKPDVIKRRNEIRRQASCPKILLGVDRIDYSKGIKERLLGLEMLLENHPELKEQFFYYQLVVPSREDVAAYVALKKEIDEIIGRINGRFATGLWAPVHYNYGTVNFNELVALYLAGDVALVTPLRDGMNLVCKEYVAAHSDNDGVLVLSKFAGAIAEIKNCLPVNPYSIEDIANAIHQALHMAAPERKRRMKKMRDNISRHNINTWLSDCFGQFEYSRKTHRHRQR